MPGDAGDAARVHARARRRPRAPRAADIARAAELLRAAKHPASSAAGARWTRRPNSSRSPNCLGAPVSTTLQGLSAFPGNHRLHAGFALGPRRGAGGRERVPGLRLPARGRHALRAKSRPAATAGSRPRTSIHVDINPRVFGANYPAAVALEGDARAVLALLRDALGRGSRARARRRRRRAPSRRTSAPTARRGSRTTRRAASIRSASSTRCAHGCRTTASWSPTTATTRSWSPS